ncbi:IclR family transcriptional regulator domain-containing protein [Pararhodobacter zhoushanensis]|uniref:Helix-turn-helix domain-containing protein n=1 Tax=Pararhodobacter zhoushanensis TaxID=2479545 RepID=A0ABT3GXG1_9RHOB|nr:IclR family transcriptional regulator C-terminal domain-containing protein [Pararhodobacter zhoushanensis]MCW1932243.1 helix-turn-helix domain-containing protein [Pararhodobacter zhoushanensis]
MAIKSTDFIGSLAKGLAVLEGFGAQGARLSVSQAAEAAGLDRAGARRCLLTLAELGYLQHDGKFFTLTPKVLRLGIGALAAMPLAQVVQPWLEQLSERIGESVSVSVLDETEIVYVARAAQRRVMSIGLMPGSRLPAHCTSMGRVLLAALPEGQAWGLLERSDLAPRTVYSVTDLEALKALLVQVRGQGFALVDQEVEIGLRSLAVPLRNGHGTVVAALNVGVAAAQRSAAELVEQVLPQLKAVQDGVARVLF